MNKFSENSKCRKETEIINKTFTPTEMETIAFKTHMRFARKIFPFIEIEADVNEI